MTSDTSGVKMLQITTCKIFRVQKYVICPVENSESWNGLSKSVAGKEELEWAELLYVYYYLVNMAANEMYQYEPAINALRHSARTSARATDRKKAGQHRPIKTNSCSYFFEAFNVKIQTWQTVTESDRAN